MYVLKFYEKKKVISVFVIDKQRENLILIKNHINITLYDNLIYFK